MCVKSTFYITILVFIMQAIVHLKTRLSFQIYRSTFQIDIGLYKNNDAIWIGESYVVFPLCRLFSLIFKCGFTLLLDVSRYLSIPNSCVCFWCYVTCSRGILSGAWSVSVCVACCVVVLLLYLMRFPRFWFVTLILFFFHEFMSLEQRYTTVAFIYTLIKIFMRYWFLTVHIFSMIFLHIKL